MSTPAATSIPFRYLRVAIAVSLTLTLAGCATPVLKPSSMCRTSSRQRQSADEPEVAWWESYGDPVLSDLIRRAAQENRDIKIAAERVRAARAGETISRSWLLPSIGVGGAAIDHKTDYDSVLKHAFRMRRTRAAPTASTCPGKSTSGRLRAGAAAAAADTMATEDRRAACACWC